MTSQPDRLPDPADGASTTLRGQVLGLRESMQAAAAATPMPARFAGEPHGNQVTITDNQTGRAVTIGLCDYHGARKTLDALFPSPELPELRWAPYQEYGIPDPAAESLGPPAGPVTIGATGYRGNDIIVYWAPVP